MIAIGVVRKFGELIRKAEEYTMEGMVEGRIETEPSVTDRFLSAIEVMFKESSEYQGITFKTRTLRDRGQNSSEKEFGADFVAVLDVKLDGYEQKKGFLSQAKIDFSGTQLQFEPYGSTTVNFNVNPEFRRLRDQTEKMLNVTPDSFVIVYSKRGFVVVPANSVHGLNKSAELYAKPVSNFFKEYLMCFIGDHRIMAYDDSSLNELRANTNARAAIGFYIRGPNLK